MKIVFDITPLGRVQTGIGYYTFNLIEHLLKLAPENKYAFLGRSTQSDSIQQVMSSLSPLINEHEMYLSKVPLKVYYYLWKYLGVSLSDLIIKGGGIYHGTSYLPLATKRGKNVITIHDLTFLLDKHRADKTAGSFLVREIRTAAHKSDHIITDSRSTRDDVIELLDINPDKVTSIPLAASSERFTFLNDEQSKLTIQAKFAGGNPFILYVGTLEPRKNLVRLVKAYSLLRKRGCTHKLVLAGKRGWCYEEIFATIRQLKLEEHVLIPDYIPAEYLNPLYNAAEVFVYPSLYEGFGLPVIEAMSCGTPVITSNISSLPEVAGEAGVLIDPEDTEGLAQAMEKVLTSNELHQTLRERGIKQAAIFSWNRTAAQTLEVYRSL